MANDKNDWVDVPISSDDWADVPITSEESLGKGSEEEAIVGGAVAGIPLGKQIVAASPSETPLPGLTSEGDITQLFPALKAMVSGERIPEVTPSQTISPFEQSKLYEEQKANIEQMQERGREQYPGIYYPTAFATGAALVPIPETGKVFDQGKLSLPALAKLSATGGGISAAYGAGESKAEGLDYLKDIAASGVTGAGVMAPLPFLGQGIKRGGKLLKSFYESMAPRTEAELAQVEQQAIKTPVANLAQQEKDLMTKASQTAFEVAGAGSREIKQAMTSKGARIAGEKLNPSNINKVGKVLIESGILTRTSHPLERLNLTEALIEKEASNVRNVMEIAGEKLKQMPKPSEETLIISPEGSLTPKTKSLVSEVQDVIQSHQEASRYQPISLSTDAKEKLGLVIDDINKAEQNQDINAFLKIRNGLQKVIGENGWAQATDEMKYIAGVYKDIYMKVADKMKKLASQADPELGKQLAESNRKLSSLYTLRGLFGSLTAKEKQIRPVEIGDYFVFGAGSVAGGPAVGAAAVLAKRYANIKQMYGKWKLGRQMEDIKQLKAPPSAPLTSKLVPGTSAVVADVTFDYKEGGKPENLQALAAKGQEKFGPAFDSYSTILNNAANQKSDEGRRAVMYSLMQRPDFREYIRKLKGENVEK